MKNVSLLACGLLAIIGAHSVRAQSFDEVLARADGRHKASPVTAPGRGPLVRLEAQGAVSRTQEPFFTAPYEVRAASAVVAFDYPLFNPAARSLVDGIARLEEQQAKLVSRLSDGEFQAVLEAYAELWLANAAAARAGDMAKTIETLESRANELVARGAISNIAATQWEEVALELRSRSLDVDLRRLDATTRLRALLDEEVAPAIELAAVPDALEPAADGHPEVVAASLRVERVRLAVAQVEGRRRPEYALSGFAGLGAADTRYSRESFDGAFGIYGLRLRMTVPLRDTAYGSDLSRTRSELARAEAERDGIRRRVKALVDAEAARSDVQRRRIELLAQSVEIAKRRHESVLRLVASGTLPEVEAVRASADSLAREGRLDEVRVERWKTWQRVRRLRR